MTAVETIRNEGSRGLMRRFRHTRTRAGAALAALALAAACAPLMPPAYHLPTDQHPVTVREVKARLDLPVAPGHITLSGGDLAALNAFVADYQARGHGPITLALPAGAGNDDAVVTAAAQVRAYLNAKGVAYAGLIGTRYDARGQHAAPVVALFTMHVAQAPQCLTGWEDTAQTFDNGNTLNFGCATHTNLAAMIDDPHDLVGPRDAGVADTARRTGVLTAYREGESTVTERTDEERVVVSTAVQ